METKPKNKKGGERTREIKGKMASTQGGERACGGWKIVS